MGSTEGHLWKKEALGIQTNRNNFLGLKTTRSTFEKKVRVKKKTKLCCGPNALPNSYCATLIKFDVLWSKHKWSVERHQASPVFGDVNAEHLELFCFLIKQLTTINICTLSRFGLNKVIFKVQQYFKYSQALHCEEVLSERSVSWIWDDLLKLKLGWPGTNANTHTLLFTSLITHCMFTHRTNKGIFDSW